MNTNFTYVMKDRPVIDFGGYTLHAFQHWLFYIRMMGFQFGRCLHGTVNNYSYSKFNVLLFFSPDLQVLPSSANMQIIFISCMHNEHKCEC